MHLLHGRRDQHADGFGQSTSVSGEQFHGLVQAGRIGTIFRQNGIIFRRQHGHACRHPRTVAPDGVDFAVVRQGAQGLGQMPGRQNIGGIPLMKYRER